MLLKKHSNCSGCRWKTPQDINSVADFLWIITAFIIGLPCSDLISQQHQSRSQLLSSHLMAFLCFVASTRLVCLLSFAPLLLFCLSVLNRCAGESVQLTSPTVLLCEQSTIFTITFPDQYIRTSSVIPLYDERHVLPASTLLSEAAQICQSLQDFCTSITVLLAAQMYPGRLAINSWHYPSNSLC